MHAMTHIIDHIGGGTRGAKGLKPIQNFRLVSHFAYYKYFAIHAHMYMYVISFMYMYMYSKEVVILR